MRMCLFFIVMCVLLFLYLFVFYRVLYLEYELNLFIYYITRTNSTRTMIIIVINSYRHKRRCHDLIILSLLAHRYALFTNKQTHFYWTL